MPRMKREIVEVLALGGAHQRPSRRSDGGKTSVSGHGGNRDSRAEGEEKLVAQERVKQQTVEHALVSQ